MNDREQLEQMKPYIDASVYRLLMASIDERDKQVRDTTDALTFAEFMEGAGYFAPYPEQLPMIEHCFQDGTNLLLASRGYGKTDLIVIGWVAWLVYRDVNDTTLIITKEETRGKAIIRNIANILRHYGVDMSVNKTTIQRKGNLSKDENVSLLTVNSAGIRGRHPRRILLDDVITPTSASPADRRQVELLYSELPKLSPNITLIGQPVHHLDLYSRLRLASDVSVMEVWHGSIPQLDQHHDLEKQRRSGVSENSIQANYFGVLLGKELLPFVDVASISSDSIDMSSIDSDIMAYLDPSYGGDFSAFAVGWVNHKLGKVYVYGRAWQKPYHMLLDEIVATCHQTVRAFKYERNGVGLVLRDMLHEHHTPVHATTVHNTGNKYARIIKYSAFAEDIVLVDDGTAECSTFITQVREYDYKSEYDDAPDAMAGLLDMLKIGRR